MTSLGVLYDFTGNAAGTTVQTVEDMVKEQWVSDLSNFDMIFIVDVLANPGNPSNNILFPVNIPISNLSIIYF